MAVSFEDVQGAARTVRHWLGSPNIVHVGTRTYGDGDYRIEVGVVRKKELHELDRRDIPIPPILRHSVRDRRGVVTEVEVRTDVVEFGAIRDLHPYTEAWDRPARGGFQINATRGGLFPWSLDAVGTLGVNMQWMGRFRLLSNNHVLSRNGLFREVFQPSVRVFGIGKLADVTGYFRIKTTKDEDITSRTPWNEYDFAYCDIDPGVASESILDIGKPNGFRDPKHGDAVRWIGETTGVVQNALIDDTDSTSKCEVAPGRWTFWRKVITFLGGSSRPGDSGSAVVGTDNKVVALICRGVQVSGRQRAFAQPIPQAFPPIDVLPPGWLD